MKKLDEYVSRRDLGRLAIAALGGVVAGSMFRVKLLAADDMKRPAATKADAHACCGLNACKGQGRGGDNACAGQGSCATSEAHFEGDDWKKARARYEAWMKKSGKKFGNAPASCAN